MTDLPSQPPLEGWERFGACVGVDPDLFFPVRGGPVKQAKAVCAGCQVRAECLEFAVRTNQTVGIWGGTSYRERRRLRGLKLAAGARPGLSVIQGGLA